MRTTRSLWTAVLTGAAVVALGLVALVGVNAAPAPEQPNGEVIFNKRCATCHSAGGRAPLVEALQGLSAEHIYHTLTAGAMQAQGAGLSDAEKHAVSDYLGNGGGREVQRADLNPCANAGDTSLTPVTWRGWSVDERNTRKQSAPVAALDAKDVPHLELKWAFAFPGVTAAAGQPTVAGKRLYIGSWDGTVYALNAETGCSYWTYKAAAAVRTAIVIEGSTGIFGDFKANVYGVDLATGKLRWKTKVDDHAQARITGSPVAWHDRVYVPVSSLEEGMAADPKYHCCSFRGSLVALRIDDGTQVWKSYTIEEAPHPTGTNHVGTPQMGPAGGAIWSAPTIDAGRNLVYVGDGNSYTSPEATTSEAVLAFDLETGKRRWAKQLNNNDVWNAACMKGKDNSNCPAAEGPDYDFGASPVLTTLGDGTDLLLAGQKSGTFYALNPESGDLLWKVKLGKGGVFGGIEFGFATDGKVAYIPVSDLDVYKMTGDGAINAVDLKTGKVLWRTANPVDTCKAHVELCSATQSAAPTLIPGAVFSASMDGHLRAYDPGNGSIVWDYDTDRSYEGVNKVQGHGGSIGSSGPTVVNGFVYQTSGYSLYGLGMPGNVLLAFGPAGKAPAAAR